MKKETMKKNCYFISSLIFRKVLLRKEMKKKIFYNVLKAGMKFQRSMLSQSNNFSFYDPVSMQNVDDITRNTQKKTHQNECL
jgi:hypothetical protein